MTAAVEIVPLLVKVLPDANVNVFVPIAKVPPAVVVNVPRRIKFPPAACEPDVLLTFKLV